MKTTFHAGDISGNGARGRRGPTSADCGAVCDASQGQAQADIHAPSSTGRSRGRVNAEKIASPEENDDKIYRRTRFTGRPAGAAAANALRKHPDRVSSRPWGECSPRSDRPAMYRSSRSTPAKGIRTEAQAAATFARSR